MSDLMNRVKEAGDAIRPTFDEVALHRLRLNAQRGHRRRVVTRRALTGLALSGVLGALVLLAWPHLQPQSTGVPTLARIDVSAAGQVEVHGVAAVRTVQVTDAETRLELLPFGIARFSVEPQRARAVRVLAGDVLVEVVGTSFTVERRASDVRVSVDEGKVRVSVGALTRLLQPGDVGVFSLERAEAEAPTPAPVATAPAQPEVLPAPLRPLPVPKKAPPQRQAGPEWRALADSGSFDEAWAALALATPKDDPEDLLRAADVARLSGHPQAALAPLRHVMKRFPDDARAPLAAFTLGRLLLEQGAPREAADAFATAQRLDPAGPLVSDALAREVEALSKAGDVPSARVRARLYLERYPAGARAKSVRQWAGIE